MNWKRGLFRLWLLTSTLWLVGVGSIAVFDSSPKLPDFSRFGTPYRPAAEQGSPKPNPFDQFDRPAAPTKEGQPGSKLKGAGEDKATLDTSGLTPVKYVRRWNLPSPAVTSFIIGTPFIVLVLGVAIGWVAKGFRN